MIQVTIFNEFLHEREDEAIAAVYPQGIHAVIAAALGAEADMGVRTATLDQPHHGLTDEVLAQTDVLLWWGHKAHDQVVDEVVARVYDRVLGGLGLIVLHSGHFSKIFRHLMGSSCALTWREDGKKERLWVVDPSHPIAASLGAYITLPNTEMYGEVFDIPAPDELVFLSWFEGGEVFRSGCTWRRGRGRIFYFRPGHETFPIYYNPDIQRVLKNAVRWATFKGNTAVKGIGEAVNEPGGYQ
jgi:trehalose utilization protein